MKTKPKTMKKSSFSSPSPFGDLTNNLIPLSSLRRLCNSAKQYNNSNTNPLNSKPFKENRVQNSISGSSVGSPGVVDPGCSYRVELVTPSRFVAPPPTPPLGEAGSGEHSYNRRQSDVKAKEAIYGLSDSFLVEKDREKAIRMPSCSPITLETILDKNLRTAVPSSHLRSSLPPQNKDKGKENDVTPIRPSLLKTNKDKGKAIALTPIRHGPLRTVNNKGIVFVSPSDETRSRDKAISSPLDNLKVNDIEIQKPSVTSGSCHLTRDNENWKASPMKSGHPIILNDLERKVQQTTAPCDLLPWEMRNKDALLTPLNLWSKKAEHKGKSLAMPSNSKPLSKPDENLVNEVFTCPPLPRRRSERKRTTKDEDLQQPKSWTDPRPKKPKTRRRVRKEADQLDFLPKDFVEKHRAYFKEVDEFELPEEEASGDDL